MQKLRIASVGSDTITIAWDHPKDPYTKMNEYNIKYYQKEKQNTTQNILTTRFNHTISDLRLQTEYVFMVRYFMNSFSRTSPVKSSIKKQATNVE